MVCGRAAWPCHDGPLGWIPAGKDLLGVLNRDNKNHEKR
jgi:hypothetical protein